MDTVNVYAFRQIRPKLLRLNTQERAALYAYCRSGERPSRKIWKQLEESGFLFEGRLRDGLCKVVLAVLRPGGDFIG